MLYCTVGGGNSPRRMTKIALFGNYGARNFGDDLMAVMFGRYLAQSGADFAVYRPGGHSPDASGFPVADSIEALLEGKDLVVYGGGGSLCDRSRQSEAYESERCRLIEVARRKGLPVGGFSIGGTGRLPQPLRPFQRSFLQAVRCLSVRNPQDVSWIREAAPGLPVEYYPDIVWQTSALFPGRPSPGNG